MLSNKGPLVAALVCYGLFVAMIVPIARSHDELGNPGDSFPHTLADATQLLVVTTSGWDSTTGTLRRLVRDKADAQWRSDGKTIPVVVGRRGLAWGVGFDQLAGTAGQGAGPQKKEGDGRSPAGVFALRDAFGFAPAESVSWIRLPYQQLTPADECIDDTLSAHYNTVVDRNAVSQVDWHSSEHMREIGQYRLGLFVDYNVQPMKSRGSCIFLHIWAGPQSPTAGCTAMDSSDLREVMTWLDPDAHPAILQMPLETYSELHDAWKLPPVSPE